MRPAGCIRYWTQFPRLIPKCRADHPRVTHPFATRVPRRAFPFDLHVLSTPPAFVLSQNQTLQTKTTQTTAQVHRKSEKSDIQQPVKTGKFTTTTLNSRKTGSPPPRWPKTTNKNHQTHY